MGHLLTLIHNFLFQRDVIARAGGWDETIRIAQDFHLVGTLAMTAGKWALYNEVSSTYRLLPTSLYHSAERRTKARNIVKTLTNLERRVAAASIRDKYRRDLAFMYLRFGRNLYDLDRRSWQACYDRARDLAPDVLPAGPWPYRLLARLIGVRLGEHAGGLLRLACSRLGR